MAPHDGLLKLLDPDPVRASEKCELLWSRLVRFFEWRQCESPTDLAQDTILRVLQKVEAGEVTFHTEDITPYFYGVARFIVKEDRRAAMKSKPLPLDDELSLGLVGLDRIETPLLMKEWLAQLPKHERQILVGYYTGDRDALRRKLGMSEGALRVRIHRLKERLVVLTGHPFSRQVP